MTRLGFPLFAVLVLSSFVASSAAQDFSYEAPGDLVDGSGTGRVDDEVYVPQMRFPIEAAPSYLNSQVWGVGGSQGPSGSQCDDRNFSYPWRDNYCESRSWSMPLCPSGQGHQGQDIRAQSCDADLHWAVAAEAGTITSIGSYSVSLTAPSGTRHRYLHMETSSLLVEEGQSVEKGERLGRVSNEFGGTPTTVHLHYDINQDVNGLGRIYVPTYMSLVRSYEDLIGMEAPPCLLIEPEGSTVDDTSECFTAFGPQSFWRVEQGAGEGGSHHWTNAYDGASPGNWGRWALHFAEAGLYRVEVNIVAPYNRSTQVPYLIQHGDSEQEIIIDQSAAEGWVELGRFEFAEGGSQAVEIFDNTGETGADLHISADALRLTRLDGGEGSDAGGDSGEDPDGDLFGGCGCQSGGGPTALSLALVGLFLFALRRKRFDR